MQRVTKQEAAARQLNAAITLHFCEGDAIAIHTLVAAALQVLVDLAQSASAQSLLKDERFIRPEKRKLWRTTLTEAENFFKHADRDPTAVLEFRKEPTHFFILDALLLHSQLTKTLSQESNVFLIWFYAAYPEVLTDGTLGALSASVNSIGVDPNDLSLFRALLQQA